MNRLRKAILLGAALACSVVAHAHHSFALYNMAKVTTLTATVREWTWANPHSWLIVDVMKTDGSVEKWSLAGSSPNMMIRWGWNAADISLGDKLMIDVHPARDGRHFAAIQAVFLSNGKVLVDPAGQSGQALASGPSALPTKPQGEPYR